MHSKTRLALATLWMLLSQGLGSAQGTVRLSVDSLGGQATGHSVFPSISIDGRFVAFRSGASDLVAGDTNSAVDVFLHDCLTGVTTRVSVDSSGVEGNLSSCISAGPRVSGDGRFVAFESNATNLVAGDTNNVRDVFVHDTQTGVTARVSVDSSGVEGNQTSLWPSISADGQFVAFQSQSSNLVGGDTNGSVDVFLRDCVLGTTELVSLATGGAQGNAYSSNASISGDGRFVAFESAATNLAAGDTNGYSDVFVHDRLAGTTERVSVNSSGAQANLGGGAPRISSDGRVIGFKGSSTNLVPGDTNGVADVFVHELATGVTERVSVDSNGVQGDNYSGDYGLSLSADGRFIAFASIASNLVVSDTNGRDDDFVRDRLAGTTERLSVDSAGAEANSDSEYPDLSGDGLLMAFDSAAYNLVSGDTNFTTDIFLRDRGPLLPAAFCFGDGSALVCPCANNGLAGHGCENSASTGGALLSGSGSPSLASDTLVLTSSNELASVLSIFLQGDAAIAPVFFGDGLRCAAGSLKRLYARNAVAGTVRVPQAGDPPISLRSAALGDPIGAGSPRYYQTYYRDPQLAFCANPPGNSWNVSSGLVVVWGQ